MHEGDGEHLAYAVGTIVASRYRLVRVIGQGGMAIVYEAEDVAKGGSVALKMLADELRYDPESIARFEREAQATRHMPTEFVGGVRDSGVAANGTPFLAMDLLRGQDFGAVLKKDPVQWDLAVAYVVMACAGIAAAHDRSIIHRDLKPANLFLEQTDEGVRVRVLDFGVSKDLEADGELTNPSGVLGTAAFMSPEQLRSVRDVDARSDVWALGLILYRAIMGAMPMRGSTAAVMGRILDEEPLPRITRLDVPRALVKVVARALDKNPKGRPPDARAFARALAPFAKRTPMLEAALEEIDRSTPSVVVAEPPRPPPTLLSPTVFVRPGVRTAPMMMPTPAMTLDGVDDRRIAAFLIGVAFAMMSFALALIAHAA